ncbi:TRAP transporter substrate-binding protein DctP [Burkholderiaceae bacterium FT117]|uniref:TRAP transporter substrate-binding protein DctP n=1 Tax=Zeimonas sediminis TaxID=2944268 RepID=UPI0023430DAA|nr:TRAP transporter substrate-binding protein DctP [Zeimonas sediminis]MCM5571440.1 TRAP transporter substrate-binding protein DctP [Zeimonas sediminis]
MKSLKLLAGALALAVLPAMPVAAQEIKISHQWKANVDGRDRATRVFVDEVRKKDPNIKFRIYPAQSLGIKPVAQFEALQNGTLEMAVFPMSYAVGKAQEFSIVIMPGTISNLDHAMRLKGTPFHQKLQALAEKNGVRIITWWWTPGGFASKDRAIGGPDSVSGLKMRAADPTFELMLKEAGSSVVNMPSSEIYPALQSGVLNATLTSAETFVSMRLYEQTNNATVGGDYNLWMLLQPLVMSKQHWDKLTPEQKKIFEEAANKSDEFFLGLQREATDKMAEAYRKAGAKVHEMTKAEFEAWLELAKKTSWAEFAKKSPEAKELLDALQAVK